MTIQYDQPVAKSPRQQEGENHAQTSLIFGILAVTVFPLVFAPLALVQANKAEKLGVRATAGKVLGWVGVGSAALGILYVTALLIFFLNSPDVAFS